MPEPTHRRRARWLLCLLLFLSGTQAAHAYHVDAQTRRFDIDDGLRYFLEEAPVAVEQLPRKKSSGAWRSLSAGPLNLINRQQGVWISFPLDSGDAAASDWVLRVHWTTFRDTDFYLRDRLSGAILEEHHSRSWAVPAGSPEPIPLAFPFQLPSHAQLEILLRLQGVDKTIAPLTLYRDDVHHSWMLERNLLYGVLGGILLAMLGYNLSLFAFVRDASYGVYCFYVLANVGYVLTMTGIGSAYVWGSSPWINTHAYGFFSSLTFAGAAWFIRTFLKLSARGGILLLIADVAIAIWLLTILVLLVSNAVAAHYVADVMGFASCFAGLGVSLYLWMQGDVSAKYLSIAWGTLILATFVLMLGLTGIIPFGPRVEYFQYAAFVVEVMLLSMALAERINREREQRIAAQDEVLEVERRGRVALRHTVEERTRELQQALRSLRQANEELSELSQTDPLTGLANRRTLDAVLEREFKRARRKQQPLALLMIDVDHFKRVNDEHGHPGGDACLRHLGRILKAGAARAEDLPARYGGEEFCVLLPGLDLQEGERVAERLRCAVEAAPCQYEGVEIALTASFGVSAIVAGQDITREQLLVQADDALYRAKERGRNRVELARGDSAASP